MDFLTRLSTLPKDIEKVLHHFYGTYTDAVKRNGEAIEKHLPILNQFLDHVIEQLKSPYAFEPYHEKITAPIDYYRFGIDFIRPLVIRNKSTILGKNNLEEITIKLSKGENVILLANHQTEPDPQAIALMLEDDFPDLAKNMIFVAGHRVITDPLTVPFSKGCNLLCIYSKNYIHHPPELKEEKQLHNQRTMHKMKGLLSSGGKCIYVAPSGGRDRLDETGKIKIAKFDPQSIEMFFLMAKKAGHPTHFYPLALSTFDLLPPPNAIQNVLGEHRQTTCTPIHLGFGSQIDMINYPGNDSPGKDERRAHRAEHIWNLVQTIYHSF